MGAPVAGGGGGGDDGDVDYLLCTEDAASAGSLQLQGPAVASTSSSPTTTAPAADGSCDDGGVVAGEEEEEVGTAVAELIGGEAEHSHSPQFDYPGRLRSGRPAVLAARADSVAWILKVRVLYGLLPVTAYLAVSHMDRFLSLHHLPGNGWAMQLLAVTCLSLAAKMEETLVPSILDLQMEGTRYIFEPRTIFRMELLVLDALDWRLRSITPFTFMYFFAYKILSSWITVHHPSQQQQCYTPPVRSCSFVSIDQGTLLSWPIIGLDEEAIIRCYRQMQQSISKNVQRESIETTMATTTVTTVVSSEELVSSSCSSSPPSKRRKMSPGT